MNQKKHQKQHHATEQVDLRPRNTYKKGMASRYLDLDGGRPRRMAAARGGGEA
jgi:hypothetical protein